jgi:dTDP-4-dehydrorhamnose 3,5-epimerase
MIFTKTSLEGAFVIEIQKLEDERGFFARTFCQREFQEHGLNPNMAQCNVSYNKTKGTLRGMHFQHAPVQEAKLIRCLRGSVFDVAVDLREGSPTFGRWHGVELNERNEREFFIPEGFAHGFQTLTDDAELLYQHTMPYTPGSEGGVRFDDPMIAIAWPLPVTVVSDRDLRLPTIGKAFTGIAA